MGVSSYGKQRESCATAAFSSMFRLIDCGESGYLPPNPSLTLCVFASIHEGPNFRRGTTSGSGGWKSRRVGGMVSGRQTTVMRTLRVGGVWRVNQPENLRQTG